MNILIIDNSVAVTGALKCALQEAALLSPEHKVTFILPAATTQKAAIEALGYTVYTLPMQEISRSSKALIKYIPFLLRNAIALKKIIRKEKIEVIQVNDFYNLLGVAAKISGYKGKLITYVRFLPNALPQALRNIWIKLAQRYADKIVAVSDAVLSQLPPHDKNIRIYDPIQLKENLPARATEPRDTVNMLYLSNYINGKGQQYAVEAFAKAYVQNNILRLKFVGGDMGLEKNRQFKKQLEERVKELSLHDAVTFQSFCDDTEKEIKQADIALNFSESESFSMTCAEAAFYGTPLIATKCGGPEEIIKDGETGLLVPVKDIDAMAAAILNMANDAAKRTAMADAGKEYVRQKFTENNFLQAFSRILQPVD